MYGCEVTITWEHNHSISSAHALSFRPISDNTKDQFYHYFDQGHSPSTAMHYHSLNLSIEYEGRDNLYEIAHADRSINPLPRDIYHLYNKWRETRHGKENGEGMFSQLEKLIEIYNKENEHDGGRAYLQCYEHKHKEITWEGSTKPQPLVLAICTPLMARAHCLIRQAGELVYCDSTSSLDRYNCPTFIISTCTSAGGIPLGVVLTSGETEDIITEATSFLKNTLPVGAFYGRGARGPEVCITDDCDAERAALHNTWPETKLLLCIFHYLQCWWTWLWDSKHGIAMHDRQPIIRLVKELVYSRSMSELEQRYSGLMKETPDSFTIKYPNLAVRFEQFWYRKTEWALSYRVEQMMRGNHTNNYAEAGMRIIKELVFGRVKAFNLTQMFQFVTITMEKYFVNRLLDMAHSRFRPGIALRYRQFMTSDMKSTITATKRVRDSIYFVEENVLEIGTLEYILDMDLGTCSCSRGSDGGACRHQAAIAREFNICSINLPPFHSKETRHTFAVLAMGEDHTMKTDFYAELRMSNSSQQCAMDVLNKDALATETNSPSDLLATPTLEDRSLLEGVDPLEKQLSSFRDSLHEVEEDMIERVREGDHNYISGLIKFISS